VQGLQGGIGFDFESGLKNALEGIDIGPHCSCADITMEILRMNLPLRWGGARHAAACFGGGVAGSGGPCGAFCAGLVALSLAFGERYKPEGCIAELVEASAQSYYDEWIARFGSTSCAELTGYPSLRGEAEREEFFTGGGAQRCTDTHIRFAVEKALQLASPAPTPPAT
jgi:C_GCAxxG_C_C family probable redox protein